MKKNKDLLINSIYLITLIILYYIIGKKSIYLYVLTISLSNIFLSCISNITIKPTLDNTKAYHTKEKVFKLTTLTLIFIMLIIALLSICISDITSIFLHISDTLPIFVLMAISTINKPLINIYTEYLENVTNKKLQERSIFIYQVLSNILLILTAILAFRIFKTSIILAISLLYGSRILSAIIIVTILYLITRGNIIKNNLRENNINYKKIIKNIYLNSIRNNLTQIIKYSYYYISVVIVYYILNARYYYQEILIDETISFIYFYALSIMEYLIYIVKMINKELSPKLSIPMRIYQNIKLILPIAIILIIISPLTCKLIFNNSDLSIYFAMVNIMGLFILLYDISFEHIKNKKLLIFSLLIGLLIKIILIVPLINSFYRMGYNLIYGDILSTSLGMFISYLINYIYIRRITKTTENYFEKLLDILYSNIILTIILVLLEFIIPIKASSYLKSLGIMIIYLIVAITIIKIKKNKK